jgi:hypothetical protein
MGATQFACAVFHGENNPLFREITSYERDFPLRLYPVAKPTVKDYAHHLELRTVNKLRREYASRYRWYCIADLDEFHYFGGQKLYEVTEEAEKKGFEAVHGFYVDRLAADGKFPKINGRLDETFPLGTNLSACARLTNQKITLARSHIRIDLGHHSARAKKWRGYARVHHLKWYDGVIQNVTDKHARCLRNGSNRIARLLALIQSGVNLSNPKLRVWTAPKLGI